MFDPVTDEALRLRRLGARGSVVAEVPVQRTSLVCHVCGREIRPEEELFWADNAPHCFQCHDMLEFELQKERKDESRVREHGTKWKKDEEGS
jgi:hypothetical protein